MWQFCTLNGAGSNPVGSRSFFLFSFSFFIYILYCQVIKKTFLQQETKKPNKIKNSTNLCNMEIMSKITSVYIFGNEFLTLGRVFPNFWYFSRDQHKKLSQKTYLFLISENFENWPKVLLWWRIAQFSIFHI